MRSSRHATLAPLLRPTHCAGARAFPDDDSSHLPRCEHATLGGRARPSVTTPPARDPARSLTIENAAAAPYGLSVALYWWIPGMILALAYFYFLYSRLPETFRPEEDGAH
jgi:hypothetical protein